MHITSYSNAVLDCSASSPSREIPCFVELKCGVGFGVKDPECTGPGMPSEEDRKSSKIKASLHWFKCSLHSVFGSSEPNSYKNAGCHTQSFTPDLTPYPGVHCPDLVKKVRGFHKALSTIVFGAYPSCLLSHQAIHIRQICGSTASVARPSSRLSRPARVRPSSCWAMTKA